MIQNTEKYEEEDEGAHMWATVQKSGNNAHSPGHLYSVGIIGT